MAEQVAGPQGLGLKGEEVEEAGEAGWSESGLAVGSLLPQVLHSSA